MNEAEYVPNPFGELQWEARGAYYRYEPSLLPVAFDLDVEMVKLLEETALSLGMLNGLTKKFSENEIALMNVPLMANEATHSSRIEGTRATLAEVFRGEKEKPADLQTELDVIEIGNYAQALRVSLAKENRLDEELMKRLHRILLSGVRGADKNPGEYKNSQNAIGLHQDTLDTAKFVPASPERTPELMKNLAVYINDDGLLNRIYKIAIVHYQFETIHPFRDGNGRIGRLLITSLMCRTGLLTHPVIYISEFFSRNRQAYIDALYAVSMRGDMNGWLQLFLRAVSTQSKIALKVLTELEEYKSELHQKIQKISQSPRMHLLVEMIFRNPYIKPVELKDAMNMSLPTASKLLYILEKEGVLRETTGKQSHKLYVAPRILEIYNANE